MEKDDKKKNFLSEHIDTIVVLGAILSSVLWINSEFTDVRKDISNVRTDLAIIKTVLQMKNIMPSDIAKCEKEK